MRDADMDNMHALLNRRHEILHNSQSTQAQKDAINRLIEVEARRAIERDQFKDSLRNPYGDLERQAEMYGRFLGGPCNAD